MTSVVVDTNIVLSALYRGGMPERCLEFCLKPGTIALYLSEEILAEYRDVLSRKKFHFSEEMIASWMKRLLNAAILVEARAIPPLDFPRDRKDAKFLALARAVSADYLITGDSDFTDVPAQFLPRTRIVSASRFCQEMNP